MTEPQPQLTPDSARAELDQVTAWVSRYQEMTSQAPAVQQRFAYLTGYLAAVDQAAAPADTNGAGKVAIIDADGNIVTGEPTTT